MLESDHQAGQICKPKKRLFMTDVVNNKAQHRYELTVDGHLAATYYKIADGVITFIHTEVSPELGGQGVGSKLVKGALDQVRADGLKVIPECPFVKAYIEKHPEYADLLKK
jgi:predicted GNAT family acetyltransferase